MHEEPLFVEKVLHVIGCYLHVVVLREEGLFVPMINADQGIDVTLIVVRHLHGRVRAAVPNVFEDMAKRVPIERLVREDLPGVTLVIAIYHRGREEGSQSDIPPTTVPEGLR
eukprot:2583496-Heterocapsa_arctica.AAC.1